MITFKLVRKYLLDTYTIGKLYYKINDKDWIYFCDTLEDKVRDLNMNGVFDDQEEKIYGKTAIPYGLYTFVLRYSPTFKKDMPYLQDVPSFTDIMIHSGVKPEDTLGCILLGLNKMKGRLIKSRDTFLNFMAILSYHPQQEYKILITNE